LQLPGPSRSLPGPGGCGRVVCAFRSHHASRQRGVMNGVSRMSRLFLLAALCGALLLSWAGASVAERLPVGDFFKDPEFRSVSLSPSGTYITVSVPRADRTVLAAFRVRDMKLVGKWDQGENRHID